MLKRTLLCLILVFSVFYNAYATENARPFIANIMSNGGNRDVILVNKGNNTLYHVRINGVEQEIVGKYPVLTGEFEGDKMIRGDKKTPEGLYYIVEYMDAATMIEKYTLDVAAKYGSGAYPLNYPNPVDRIYQKTGHGIWLHGLDPFRHKPATEGCVAMHNEYLDSLKEVLDIGTPVFVVQDALYLSADEYKDESSSYMEKLNTYVKVWTYGPYDEFKKYVHPLYKSYSAGDKSAFLAKKKYLMDRYPDKQIIVNDVYVFNKDGNVTIYDFNQFYCAENLVSYGNKRLYTLDGMVITEEMIPGSVKDYLDPFIKEFITQWKNSWESMLIDDYLGFYSAGMQDKIAGKKRFFFENAESIDVEISDLRWFVQSGNTYTVIFNQRYTSGVTSDYGVKTLTVQGCPGGFKITSEEWRPL